MHISDMEFALARGYHANVDAVVTQANRTINAQNQTIRELRARVAELEAVQHGAALHAKSRAIRAGLHAN